MKSILKKSIYPILAGVVLSGCIFVMPTQTAKAENDLDKRYYDEAVISYASEITESITFARKEEEIIELPYAVPTYYTSTLSNACGPVAGANVIGFYDKYYEELIPNYTAYYPANGRYRRPDSTYVPALMNELYSLMQTNVVDVGVSVSECLTGLQDYVESKSLTISYTSLKTTTFNETVYKNALSNLKPSLLFCASAEIYYLRSDTTQDDVLYVLTSGSHIAVAYGYHKVRYYNDSNVNFRTDTYLRVSTGWGTTSTGYLKMNDVSWLDAAYVVNIT